MLRVDNLWSSPGFFNFLSFFPASNIYESSVLQVFVNVVLYLFTHSVVQLHHSFTVLSAINSRPV